MRAYPYADTEMEILPPFLDQSFLNGGEILGSVHNHWILELSLTYHTYQNTCFVFQGAQACRAKSTNCSRDY